MGIQLFVPKFDVEACLKEIRTCLEKGWTGMGFKTVEFEEAWKHYTKHENAFFTNSATSALNLAVSVMKNRYYWNDGDEIVTTPITFVSTNHAILKANMKAVFADIDDTFCLSPESVRSRISSKTRAVMFVGMGGNCGHLSEIAELCREHRLKLILDAAHMAGTLLKGTCPGLLADVAAYSFQAVKNLPTADSGMLCFREKELDEISRKIAWLGINKDTFSRVGSQGAYKWEYDVEYVGEKYHGNSVVAAIALAQLPHLEEGNEYRRKLAELYDCKFAERKDLIETPLILPECVPSRHLYQILCEDRNTLIMELNKKGIYPGVHYIDNTRYSMYRYADGSCPNARRVSEHTCSLPLHLNLTEENVKTTADSVVEILNHLQS